MTRPYIRKSPLTLLLEASDRIHAAEMKTLFAEVARIKQAYAKKHGKKRS